jgi:hypothetical protein
MFYMPLTSDSIEEFKLYVDEVSDFSLSVWDTKFINDLPDSSFSYIESGGKQDSSGKTEPRSLRHLPYKDASGKVDLPHLRNALARLSQTQGIPAAEKEKIRTKLEKLLKEEDGFKNMAEPTVVEQVAPIAAPMVAPTPAPTPTPAPVQTQAPQVDIVAALDKVISSKLDGLKGDLTARMDAVEAQLKPPTPAPTLEPKAFPEIRQNGEDSEISKLRSQVAEMQKALNAPTRQSSEVSEPAPAPISVMDRIRELDKEKVKEIKAMLPK